MILTNMGLNTVTLVLTLFALLLYVLKSPLMLFWGLNPGPLVCTLFALFIYGPNSTLLVFLSLKFSHQQDYIPKVLDSFQYFVLKLNFGILPRNFKISFTVFFNIVQFYAHSISNRCAFSCSRIRHSPMSDIHLHSDYGSRDPDTGDFIQYVDCR